jgi:hypothetical protein
MYAYLNPQKWLENFRADEEDHAVCLLNSFVYFSHGLIDQMFLAAFQGLSCYLRRPGDSLLSVQTAWRSFFDRAIITYVTGENPSVTDSGLTFARKARQVLGINEGQILSPGEAASELYRGRIRPIVFVDDFVGSGNQFLETWERSMDISGGFSISFAQLAALRGTEFYYCPLVCTEFGYERLRTSCPRVALNPAHIIVDRYNALNPDSVIWSDNLRSTAVDFLQAVSSRAGIPDNGGGVGDWRGFNSLGLTIAFAHSVPDATLPIFYWENNGWLPLVRQG